MFLGCADNTCCRLEREEGEEVEREGERERKREGEEGGRDRGGE